MDVKEITLPKRTYLTLRLAIQISQISEKKMYEDAGQKLGAYMKKNGIHPSGPWTVLYFGWNPVAGSADIGISFPIDGLKSVDDPELALFELPESKASMTALIGPYEGLKETHQSLGGYVKQAGFETAGQSIFALEEYMVDPMTESDPKKWVTNVYHLHK